MNRGQTLKIMEYGYDEYPPLAGTPITSTKPIAVTVTEDMVDGDTSGDQIVPLSSLGTRYIIPRGYKNPTQNFSPAPERIYIGGTAANTAVSIYATSGAGAPDATLTLTAGQVERYDFASGVNALYLEATRPVYVYHRSGYGEEGAALLPSVYAIGQTQLSFYQVSVQDQSSAAVQKGFMVFRSGAEAGFSISYGAGASFQPMSLTPLAVPKVSDWKVARFDYAAPPAAGRTVTIRNEQSPFSLGYIMGNVVNNDSYGYFSAFGTFEFPALTYMCGPSVILQGGYAGSYLWSFPDGHTETTSSITATEEGAYTLLMEQDPNTVTATTTVVRVNAGSLNCTDTTVCTGSSPGPLTVEGASGDTWQWQSSLDGTNYTDISGATSPAYTPPALTRVTWFRRGTGAGDCDMVYPATGVRIGISPCTLPVNPHLMVRFRQ
jgi:hypothetical protein